MTEISMLLLRLTAAAIISIPTTTTFASSSSSSTTVVRAKHVVGAGLGRTGTMSFKESIVQLGLGPVFHMEDCLQHPEYIPLWEQLAHLSPLDMIGSNEPIWESKTLREPNRERIQLLSQILGIDTTTTTDTTPNVNNNATTTTKTKTVYTSTMDFPTCLYFRDMIEVYQQVVDDPREVKVVLTSRTSGTKWASSFVDTIGKWIPALQPLGMSLSLSLLPPLWKINTILRSTFIRLFPLNLAQGYSTVSKREQRLGQYHDQWNEHVRAVMQEYAHTHNIALDDVFLDFQVQQGWEPLCRFLGIDDDQHPSCPHNNNNNNKETDTVAVPYPHVNDKHKYALFLSYLTLFGYAWTAVLLFMVYYLLRWFQQKLVAAVAPEVNNDNNNKENKPKQS